MTSLDVLAPAKINLYLRVRGIREDGFHELETAFCYVDVYDRLHCSLADDLLVSCSIDNLEGESNLVFRALDLLRRHTGADKGMHVHIDKTLPLQAGLGGGSSDAASAILAANELWDLHLDIASLIRLFSSLGADIPCFLYGRASKASGIGDELSDLSLPLPAGVVLLAWPGAGLSTAEVFAHFDRRYRPAASTQAPTTGEGALTSQNTPDTMPRNFILGENDLEPVACELSPAVSRLLGVMRRQAKAAWMSGSGSACVALMSDRAEAIALRQQLEEMDLVGWVHIGRMLTEHPERSRLMTG